MKIDNIYQELKKIALEYDIPIIIPRQHPPCSNRLRSTSSVEDESGLIFIDYVGLLR